MISGRSLLFIIALVTVTVMLSISSESMVPGFFADEAVYFGMIQSLAYDLDLTWSRADMERICQTHPAGPVGIILKEKSDGRIVYAKPITYPLATALFYRIAGNKGIILFNLLAVWFIVFQLVKHWGSTLFASLTALTFMSLSAYLPYVLWYHPEIFTSFLLVGFAGNWLSPRSPQNENKQLIWMSVFLALAVTIKPPLIVLGIPASIEMIARKRFRPFIYFGITITIIILLSLLFTGDINPYEGNRKIFLNQFPLDSAENAFNQGDSWSMENADFFFNWNVFIWNCFYFFTGRFSGIIWYFFPGIMLAILALVTRGNRRGKWLLVSIALLMLLQIILIPSNYHGGGGALGNRYFVNLYPLLLFTIPRPPHYRRVAIISTIAAFFCGPFLIHPWLSSYQPGEFTRRGFFSLLPVEWTLSGAYPIFQANLSRVALPGLDGLLYFLDGQTSGRIENGFEVFGGGSCRILYETSKPMDNIDLYVKGVRTHSRGVIIAQSIKTDFFADPLTFNAFRIPLGKGHEKRDIYGINRWLYPIRIKLSPLKDLSDTSIPPKVFIRTSP